MGLGLGVFAVGVGVALLAACHYSRWWQWTSQESTIPLSSPNHSPGASVSNTVIIGAGVAGLSTAYNLAKRFRETDQSHRIIVIDVLDDLFAAASRYNSGILSYQWFSGGLKKFGEYAYALYEDLANKSEEFRVQCGYCDHSNFRLRRGGSPSVDGVPKWLCVPKGWHVEADPRDGRAATINPIGLGKWLLLQCRRNGVEVYNLARILRAQLSTSGMLERVQIHRGGQITDIPCDNLVFAAGAWTPRLFNEMFPASNVTFYPLTNSGNWVIFKRPTKPSRRDLGQVILDDVVGHQLEFVGRDDETIWTSGLNNTKECLGDVKGRDKPDVEAVSMLLDYAKRFLVPPDTDSPIDLHVVDTGRTYRPTIDRELAIVTRVDPGRLCSPGVLEGDRKVDGERRIPGGVFVCSGHGKYGITLEMGSGKLMSQIIAGDTPEYDVTNLGLPT